jgi:broad specificity phosphatase PhoE
MSELYLIRHGQASFGQKNYDRLSPLGLKQAQAVGHHLAGLGRIFDAVYCGRLERQKKTAAALIECYRQADLAAPDLIVAEALDEYDSTAVWESQIQQLIQEEPAVAEAMGNIYSNRKAFQGLFSKVFLRWVSGEFDRPGIRPWQDYKRQVQEGFRQIMQRQGAKKRLAAFTSGGPICITIQTALDLSDRTAIELCWQIMNASVTRLFYNARGLTLSVFNDVTHLEMAGGEELISYR